MRILILLTLIPFVSFGQIVIKKDTVYLTKNKMSHILFYNQISHVDYGSNVVASDNGIPIVETINNKDMLIVKAKKRFKEPTNISVITINDFHYDITCIYSNDLDDNYYIMDTPKIEEATIYSKEKNEDLQRQKELEQRKYKEQLDIENSYKDKGEYKEIAEKEFLVETKYKDVKRVSTRKGDVYLKFNNAFARMDKLYIKITIYNEGVMPYSIGDIQFYVSKDKKVFDAKQTFGEDRIDHIYQTPISFKEVRAKSSLTKVFVFEPFSLEKDDYLKIHLFERADQNNPNKKSRLNLTLPVDSRHIRNAIVFNPKRTKEEIKTENKVRALNK